MERFIIVILKKIIEYNEEALKHLKKENNEFTLNYRFTSHGILDQFLSAHPSVQPKKISNICSEDFNSVLHWQENHLYFVRRDIINSKNIDYRFAYKSKIYAAVSSHSKLAKKRISDCSGFRK